MALRLFIIKTMLVKAVLDIIYKLNKSNLNNWVHTLVNCK